MNSKNSAFLPYRVVAEFADGQRLAFSGITMEQAKDAMMAAQDEHGDIGYWNTVTDENYDDGVYYMLTPVSGLCISAIDTSDGLLTFRIATTDRAEQARLADEITRRLSRFDYKPSAEEVRAALDGLDVTF